MVSAIQTTSAVVIPNAYTWLTGKFNMILNDNVHPGIGGHMVIASHIENALITGNSMPYPSAIALEKESVISEGGYLTLTQENAKIRFNGVFAVSSEISNGTLIFSRETTSGFDIPCYIGNYGRTFLITNTSTGTTYPLYISCDITSTGYRFEVRTIVSIAAGNYAITDQEMPFGVQQYASNVI